VTNSGVSGRATGSPLSSEASAAGTKTASLTGASASAIGAAFAGTASVMGASATASGKGSATNTGSLWEVSTGGESRSMLRRARLGRGGRGGMGSSLGTASGEVASAAKESVPAAASASAEKDDALEASAMCSANK